MLVTHCTKSAALIYHHNSSTAFSTIVDFIIFPEYVCNEFKHGSVMHQDILYITSAAVGHFGAITDAIPVRLITSKYIYAEPSLSLFQHHRRFDPSARLHAHRRCLDQSDVHYCALQLYE